MFAIDSMAVNIPSGNTVAINHPDKKVSPPAVAVYGGKIYVSYIREDGYVYLRAGHPENESVTPVKVNDDGSLADGIHQSPGIAVGPRGEIYIAWVSPKGGGEFATDIRFTRSLDGGKTFLPSVVINDNQNPSSRGFESITVAKDGTIYISWLDGREKKNDVSTPYFTRSIDGGNSFGKNLRLDDDACPCCRTVVATGPDGTVYVSWRRVFDGDIRDMVVACS